MDTLATPARSGQTRKRVIALLALVIAAVAVVAFAAKLRRVAPRRSTLVAVGRPLPNLQVLDPLGRPVDVSTLATGKRRVIAFYSPSCDACRRELPELDPFPANLSLVMIREPAEGAAADALGAGFTTGIRYEDRDHVLNRAFAMPALPTLLFVDEHGVVRDGLIGTHPPRVTRGRLAAFAASHG